MRLTGSSRSICNSAADSHRRVFTIRFMRRYTAWRSSSPSSGIMKVLKQCFMMRGDAILGKKILTCLLSEHRRSSPTHPGVSKKLNIPPPSLQSIRALRRWGLFLPLVGLHHFYTATPTRGSTIAVSMHLLGLHHFYKK